jgi:hypothetical protein
LGVGVVRSLVCIYIRRTVNKKTGLCCMAQANRTTSNWKPNVATYQLPSAIILNQFTHQTRFKMLFKINDMLVNMKRSSLRGAKWKIPTARGNKIAKLAILVS